MKQPSDRSGSPGREQPGDFTGVQPLWPRQASELWQRCAASASHMPRSAAHPDMMGDLQLREELARRLGFAVDELTIVSGARAAAAAYGRAASRLVLERPTFSGIGHAFTAVRAVWQHVSWDEFGCVPAEATIWVTSPCRNPDGLSLTSAQRETLARRCGEGGRVVVNRTYQWFANERLPPGVESVTSLHKLAGREARIAAVRSPTFASESRDWLSFLVPPVPWQRTWALFIREGGLELLVQAQAQTVAVAEAAFRAGFQECRPEAALPGTGPNALIPLRAGISEAAAVTTLARHGYQVVAGHYFASPYPAVRVSFSGVTPGQASALARAMCTLDLPG